MQVLIQVSKELPVLLIQMVSKELLNSGDWGVDELPVGLINIYTCRYLYANYRDGVGICVCLHEAETHN